MKWTRKEIEVIETTTNHVTEDMLSCCTKKQLGEAVKYWSLVASYRYSDLNSFKNQLALWVLTYKQEPYEESLIASKDSQKANNQ